MFELDALGTHWWIEPLAGARLSDELQQQLTDRIRTFERTYTRFTDTSLLGRLNKYKYLTDPSEEFRDMLVFARDLQRQTDGIFNISVGGELVRRGYGQLKEHGSVSGSFWDKVVINDTEVSIPDDIVLDFGGFGKGWLIDQLGVLLRGAYVEQFVIDGGGDILVSSDEPIELALERPYDPGKAIGSTRITHGALAVSSSVKRTWNKDGQRQHHIIDPRTQAPSVSDIVCTYVRASSALIADVCATVLLIAPDVEPRLAEAYSLKTILLRQNQLSAA